LILYFAGIGWFQLLFHFSIQFIAWFDSILQRRLFCQWQPNYQAMKKEKMSGLSSREFLCGILMASFQRLYFRMEQLENGVLYFGRIYDFSLTFVYFKLPSVKPTFKDSYFKIISSSFYQLKRFPQLRLLALMGELLSQYFAHSGQP
jgi:hypothetical protein